MRVNYARIAQGHYYMVLLAVALAGCTMFGDRARENILEPAMVFAGAGIQADATFAGALSDAGYDHSHENAGCFEVRVANGRVDADEFFVLASRCGVTLTGVDRRRSSLEDVFLRTLAENRGEDS